MELPNNRGDEASPKSTPLFIKLIEMLTKVSHIPNKQVITKTIWLLSPNSW